MLITSLLFRARKNDVKVLCQEVSQLHLIAKKFCVDISQMGISYDFEKFGKCSVQELRGHSNPRLAFFRIQRKVDENGNFEGFLYHLYVLISKLLNEQGFVLITRSHFIVELYWKPKVDQ